jgi:hypothetical protein
MNNNPPIELQKGMLVFTSDGDELGRIKDIDGDCFQLDLPLRRDFWLERDTVESTEFGVARLNVPKDTFNRQTDAAIEESNTVYRQNADIQDGHHTMLEHRGIHQH